MRKIKKICCIVLAVAVVALGLPRSAGASQALTTQPQPTVVPPQEPSLSHWLVGFERLAGQMEAGQTVASEFSIVPGYLPIAEKGAAQALRKMLSGVQVRFAQHALRADGGQNLTFTLAGQPLLGLAHEVQNGRAIWSSPQWGQVVETPAGANLFGELFGLRPLMNAIFAAPRGKTEGKEPGYVSALRLLRISGSETVTLKPAAVMALMALWKADLEADIPLGKLTEGWQVLDETVVEHDVDDQGGWTLIRLRTRVGYGQEEPWAVNIKLTQVESAKRHAYAADITVQQDKSNTFRLQITHEIAVNAGKQQTQMDTQINCAGKLRGKSVDLRASNRITNEYQTEAGELVEQLKQSATLQWKARVPEWERLNLGEWNLSMTQKGTLRSAEAPEKPVTWDGSIAVTATCIRRDFLSAEAVWTLRTLPTAALDVPAPTLVWESVQEAERSQLAEQRQALKQEMTQRLVRALDADTLEGIWLR